jgi:hypothetical protein
MALYQLIASGGVLRLSDDAAIPADPANGDYQSYLAWVAAGNTPAPIPLAAPITTISSGAFLTRFTAAEQGAIQQAALSSAPIALGLTIGLAYGTIDLTGATLSNWMQGLVTANVITPARALEILS